MKKLFSLLLLLSTLNLFGQDKDIPFNDLPPVSEYGKCFAKCKVPDEYENVSVEVLVRPESKKLVKVPAEYETITERVMVKEGSVSFRTIPATYKNVQETVMVEGERKVSRTIPAKYTTESTRILVSEARGEWVKKKKAPNCFSQNPDDCYIVCWEEVPAQYRTETRTVEVEPAHTVEDVVPAKYKTVTKKMVDTPARTEEIPVEPVYQTVTRRVVKTPESTREEVIPAKYTTKTERRLVKKGGFTVWTEILCESKTTNEKVVQIQKALQAKGYDPGTIDGVMGIKTQAAMKQFQVDSNLPTGNMNMETLKALGISEN